MPKIGMTNLAPVALRNQSFYQYFNRQYFRKALSIDPQNLIGYWPMWEASGSVAYDLSPQGNNGAYTTVTLGEIGIGDGRSCPLFDGSASFNNIYSAGFKNGFDGEEGTVAIWAKMGPTGSWTTGGGDRYINLKAGGQNYIEVGKYFEDNKVYWKYEAGDTVETTIKAGITTLDFLFMALTWSKTNDEVIPYYNGIQEGATHTGIGSWVGALSATRTVIGAADTVPANVWNGYLGHALAFKTPLAAEQILRLYHR